MRCRHPKNHPTKEVHYLDRWPHFRGSEAEYAAGYPAAEVRSAEANATAQLRAAGVGLGTLEHAAGVREAYAGLSHDVAFVDETPNYLPVAHVPPRASLIMPHARIVVVLRVRRCCPFARIPNCAEFWCQPSRFCRGTHAWLTQLASS